MGRQLGNNSINGVLNSSPLDVLLTAIVVLVDGFEPSNIIMRMGDEMNGDVGCIGRGWMMMVFLHHVFVGESDVGVEGKKEKKADEILFHKEIFIKDMK